MIWRSFEEPDRTISVFIRAMGTPASIRDAGIVTATRLAIGIALVLLASPAHAEDPPPIQVTIKDRSFSPSEIRVKSGQPSFLEITNADATPEEFEIRQLAIEKLRMAHRSLTLASRDSVIEFTDRGGRRA
jgi:hypothetical protein